MSDLQKNNQVEELKEDELKKVSGGFNPQPDPPAYISSAAAFQRVLAARNQA
jgi:bacteriocin-like protein